MANKPKIGDKLTGLDLPSKPKNPVGTRLNLMGKVGKPINKTKPVPMPGKVR
jgi:hypothetical protein